jgi:hypothetical protein
MSNLVVLLLLTDNPHRMAIQVSVAVIVGRLCSSFGDVLILGCILNNILEFSFLHHF